MRAFHVLVGQYEIVGTTGQAHGSVPVPKSMAVAYDVIDRKASGGDPYVCRDKTFVDAFELCVKKAAVRLVH